MIGIKRLNFGFTIKIKPVQKIKRVSKGYTRVGRKCEAVVLNDEGVLKARLLRSPVEECDDSIALPFTDNSFNLKGKNWIFSKTRDKYGRRICIIRTDQESEHFPGSPECYEALQEGLRIAGHIVKQDGKYYFDYETLIAYSERGDKIYDYRSTIVDKNDESESNKSS